MSDGKGSTKNKFELDRLSLVAYIYWMQSMLFLLNAKLWSGDHIPLMDYK